MRAKARVLAEYPDARLVAVERYKFGGVYWRVYAGERPLDIHRHSNEVRFDSDYEGFVVQGATAAWRSALFQINRDKAKA